MKLLYSCTWSTQSQRVEREESFELEREEKGNRDERVL